MAKQANQSAVHEWWPRPACWSAWPCAAQGAGIMLTISSLCGAPSPPPATATDAAPEVEAANRAIEAASVPALTLLATSEAAQVIGKNGRKVQEHAGAACASAASLRAPEAYGVPAALWLW